MPVKSIRKKQSVFIEASGDMGVEQSGEFLEVLKKAMSGPEINISLDLSGATGPDVTCLQLICSAHKSAAKSGKSMTISGLAPEFLQAAIDAGFSGQNDCSSEMSVSCLWNIAEGAL